MGKSLLPTGIFSGLDFLGGADVLRYFGILGISIVAKRDIFTINMEKGKRVVGAVYLLGYLWGTDCLAADLF